MDVEEYEKMTEQIEKSKKLLDQRLDRYVKVYREKKIYRDAQTPKLAIIYNAVDMITYCNDDSDISDININFDTYKIDISFIENFSGCSAESSDFSLPSDILFGTDAEYIKYLDKLESEIAAHNLKEEAKLNERLKQIEDNIKKEERVQELKELKRLKVKYETSN